LIQLVAMSTPIHGVVHPDRQLLLISGWEDGEDEMELDSSQPPAIAMKTATNELELGPDATISLSGSVPLSPSQRKQLLDMLIDNVTVFAEHPSRTPTTTLARHRNRHRL